MGLPRIPPGTSHRVRAVDPTPVCPAVAYPPTPRRRLWGASAAQRPLAAGAVEGRGVAGDAGGRGVRDMLAITPAVRTQMAEVQQGCGV